jgi:hypothetical protein
MADISFLDQVFKERQSTGPQYLFDVLREQEEQQEGK